MIGRILALAIGLICALAASQLPEFAQQYRQRLGGAVEELGRVVGRFDENAQASGLSRDQAIARLGEQPDPLVRREGEAMGGAAERLAQLKRQREDFTTAGSFERVLVLIRQMDPGLARSTYLDFEPAVPATSEGVVAAAAGFVFGWAGMLFLAHLLGRLRPRVRPPVARVRSA
jgi:hypothetical protein